MLLGEITTTKTEQTLLSELSKCENLWLFAKLSKSQSHHVITSYKCFSMLYVLEYLQLLIPNFRLSLLIKQLFVSDVELVNAILESLKNMFSPVQNPDIKGLEVDKPSFKAGSILFWIRRHYFTRRPET